MANPWLSVMVIANQKLIKPRQIVKCSWDETFAVLLDKLDLPETTIVSKIEISGNKPHPVHMVPIDAPLNLCEQFKCSNVLITVEGEPCVDQMASSQRNAADVLMEASRRLVLPVALVPPAGKTLRNDQKLYNDLLGM